MDTPQQVVFLPKKKRTTIVFTDGFSIRLKVRRLFNAFYAYTNGQKVVFILRNRRIHAVRRHVLTDEDVDAVLPILDEISGRVFNIDLLIWNFPRRGAVQQSPRPLSSEVSFSEDT